MIFKVFFFYFYKKLENMKKKFPFLFYLSRFSLLFSLSSTLLSPIKMTRVKWPSGRDKKKYNNDKKRKGHEITGKEIHHAETTPELEIHYEKTTSEEIYRQKDNCSQFQLNSETMVFFVLFNPFFAFMYTPTALIKGGFGWSGDLWSSKKLLGSLLNEPCSICTLDNVGKAKQCETHPT